MWEEFKKFAFKGNVVDMAIGVVIGAAFGAIVKNIVDNLLMPPIGLLVGGIDFGELYVVLKPPTTPGNYQTGEELVKAGAVVLRYGLVLNSIISFLIIAVAVFGLVQVLQRAMKKPEGPPTTRDCPECTSAIPLKAKRCPQCTASVEPAAA